MDDALFTVKVLSDNGSIFESVAFWGVVIGLITFYIEHKFSKNKFRHELTLTCLERYQNIVKQDYLKQAEVNHYLGFMNEELYYIQHGLVDRKMGREWLANMINYLPILVKENNELIPINLELLKKTGSIFADKQEWEKLFRYTRLRKAIYIKGNLEDYKFMYVDDLLEGYQHMSYNIAIRRKIVHQILINLDSDCWYRCLYRRIMR